LPSPSTRNNNEIASSSSTATTTKKFTPCPSQYKKRAYFYGGRHKKLYERKLGKVVIKKTENSDCNCNCNDNYVILQ
jgi:hypothetical protein